MIYLAQVPPSPDGQNRKGRLHQAAWALLAYGLQEAAPQVVLADSLRFGPHGKPALAGGPHISLAHTKGLALCAIEGWNTGVDAEPRRMFSPLLRGRVFTPRERGLAAASPDPDALFTTLWTLKESYMKYTGLGLAQGPGTLSFSFKGGRPRLDGEGLWFCTAEWQGYVVSQCGPGPFSLDIRPVEYDRLGLPG